ncbi:MAG: hypothetical protein DBX53_02485 [Clostridiales bacterium]|nr:MAG: hypothetical protein DBX53_02485 [Clostridiales bacterium]
MTIILNIIYYLFNNIVRKIFLFYKKTSNNILFCRTDLNRKSQLRLPRSKMASARRIAAINEYYPYTGIPCFISERE